MGGGRGSEGGMTCTALSRIYPSFDDRIAAHARTIHAYGRRVQRLELPLERLEGHARILYVRYGVPEEAILRSLVAAYTWVLLLPGATGRKRWRIAAARDRALDMVVQTI